MPNSRAPERLVAARKEIATCAISGAVGTFAQYRSARRGACRREAGPDGRAGLDAGDPARPPRDVLRDARRHRLLDRAARDRDPPSAAHRSAGSRGVLLGGPEGLVGDAAQAQSGADGKPHRPRPHGARLRDAGDGERRALARARHLAFLGRAHDRAGRDGDARFRARAPHRRDRQAAGLSGEHAEESRPARRPGPFAARAAGADAKGRVARGRLPAGAAQRHAGLARRRRFPDAAEGRRGRRRRISATPRSKRISTSAITSSTSTRSSGACSARRSAKENRRDKARRSIVRQPER